MNTSVKHNPSIEKIISSGPQTIAIIGCSSNPYRTSYHVADYLQKAGLTIIPVNPNEQEVLGEKSYPSVFQIPETAKIDIIDIFRNKKYTEDMVRQITDWCEQTGQKPVVWTQLDVSTDASKKRAADNGLVYVENRCLMVEHKRFSGE